MVGPFFGGSFFGGGFFGGGGGVNRNIIDGRAIIHEKKIRRRKDEDDLMAISAMLMQQIQYWTRK